MRSKAKPTKCSNARRYKAVHPPTCLTGIGCDVCRKKWQDNERRVLKEVLESASRTVARWPEWRRSDVAREQLAKLKNRY